MITSDDLNRDQWDVTPTVAALDEDVGIIRAVGGLKVDRYVHLVLASSWRELEVAIDRIRGAAPPRATTETIDAHIPCLLYGNTHWKTIQEELQHLLLQETRQAFIGTMNTFAIDCFYFDTPGRLWQTVLLVQDGYIFRMSSDQAADVFRAYQAGIQHFSEILRTQGIW